MGNSIKNRRRQAQIREYAEPRGLYDTCAWDRRYIRKEILGGKLAPCFPGEEGGANLDVGTNDRTKSISGGKLGFGDLEECPICLLFYPGGLNRMTCCKQSMCTECYLQVKEPPTSFSPSRSRCPFCKSDKFDHIYTGPLSMEQKKAQEIEQQKVLELQIKMQSEERKKDQERQQQKAKAAAEGVDTKVSVEDKKAEHLRAHSTSFSVSSQTPEPEQTDPEPVMNNNTGEGHHLGVSVVGGGGMIGNGDYDMNDIEQLMLEEALRRSLIESKGNSNEINMIVNNDESLDAKSHVPPTDDLTSAPASDEDEDALEEGDELHRALALSLELQNSASASSASSSPASSSPASSLT